MLSRGTSTVRTVRQQQQQQTEAVAGISDKPSTNTTVYWIHNNDGRPKPEEGGEEGGEHGAQCKPQRADLRYIERTPSPTQFSGLMLRTSEGWWHAVRLQCLSLLGATCAPERALHVFDHPSACNLPCITCVWSILAAKPHTQTHYAHPPHGSKPPTPPAGKWMMFYPRDRIDAAWRVAKQAYATRAGGWADVASMKVSTALENPRASVGAVAVGQSSCMQAS